MRILVAEDEQLLAHQIKQALSADGRAVDIASDGAEALFLGETEPYDMMIIDLSLPVKDGSIVLNSLRASGIATPVLMMAARNAQTGRIDGLDVGADDYVTKPFHMDELSDRVRAIMQRKMAVAVPVYAKNDVTYDSQINQVLLNGVPVNLTRQEVAVVSYLFQNAGRLVSQAELSKHIYPMDDDRVSNTIAVFVNRLRKKLGSELIDTVRGRGYVIKPAA